MFTSSRMARLTRSAAWGSSWVLAVVLTIAAWTGSAHATHFRYGHITWRHKTGMTNTVEFTVQNAWRRDGVTDGEFQCVDTTNATLPQVPCSGADGNPSVGDVFVEFQGGTKFDLGDGSAMVGSPRGPLAYLVTSEDPVNNWVFALALDPSSLPSASRAPANQDTTIQHTYSRSGARTAKVSDCCRISPCNAPNAHMNNPDNNYVVSTTVDVGSGTARR